MGDFRDPMMAPDTYRGVSVDEMLKEGFDFWSSSVEERKRFADHMRAMLKGEPKAPSQFQQEMEDWMPS